jgi:hypothetical protein
VVEAPDHLGFAGVRPPKVQVYPTRGLFLRLSGSRVGDGLAAPSQAADSGGLTHAYIGI